MRNSFLKKMLVLVVATMLLSLLLTATIYRVTVRRSFAVIKADDLTQDAVLISDYYLAYMGGLISAEAFHDYINANSVANTISVFVYDQSGQLVTGLANAELREAVEVYLPIVMEGETVRAVPEFSFYSAGSALVGIPIQVRGQSVVLGAVFLVQPLIEMEPAVDSMTLTLYATMLIVMGFVGIIAIFASQRFARPINHMRDIALIMASGDFDVRADERPRDEIGQLGRSLNYLSAQLSATIGELVLERNRLKSILDGLNEGIIALDADGCITHINPALQRIFKFDTGEDGAARREDVIDDAGLWEDFDRCIHGALPVLRSYQREGRTYRVNISPLTPEGCCEGAAGAVALFYDITQSERLEQSRRGGNMSRMFPMSCARRFPPCGDWPRRSPTASSRTRTGECSIMGIFSGSPSVWRD